MAFATLVSIDAWRNSCGGWDRNNQFKLCKYTHEEVSAILVGENPRKIFGFLRREGYLSAKSVGKLRLDVAGSEPDYFTIENKNTCEPIFAFIVDWSEVPDITDVSACQKELGEAYVKHLDGQLKDGRGFSKEAVVSIAEGLNTQKS